MASRHPWVCRLVLKNLVGETRVDDRLPIIEEKFSNVREQVAYGNGNWLLFFVAAFLVWEYPGFCVNRFFT
jgi:hypothetical protein